MICFSENIIQFTQRLTHHAKAILKGDMHLIVKHKRFLFRDHLYPINIVCFEHTSKLGYFDPTLFEIGIHIDLMLDEGQAIDVLKHELAHFITYLEYDKCDHGAEFRMVAARYRFPPEIAKAVTTKRPEQSLHSIQNKVKKLLRLSENSSLHEAQSALLKAEELIAKHGLSSLPTQEERYVIERLLKSKRISTKQRTIGQILRYFHVEVIFHQGRACTYIEVIGSQEHVEISSYVADFLDKRLDKLWLQAKKEHGLKGMSAKNSFLRGIASGYEQQKRAPSQQEGLIRTSLSRAVAMVYPKLSQSSSSARHDPSSHSLGKKVGQSLQIDHAIGKSSRPLISYG